MSNCREFEDLLPLHAVGETGLDEALAVEEHLGGCPSCGAEVAAFRELSGSLRRELGDVPPVPGPTPAAPPLFLAGWRGMALAAGLLLAGILVGRWSMPEPPGMGIPTPVMNEARALSRPPAFSVFSPAARRFLSEAAQGEGRAISPARTQP
jgi:anti-sigma factor RsiW